MRQIVLLFCLVILAASVSQGQWQVKTDSSKVVTNFLHDSVDVRTPAGTASQILGYVSNIGATRYLFVAFDQDTARTQYIRIAPGDAQWIMGTAKIVRMKAATDSTYREYSIYRQR